MNPLETSLDRRRMLGRLAVLGAAVPFAGVVLAACSDNDKQEGKAASTAGSATTAPAQAGAATQQAVNVPFLPAPKIAAPITRKTADTVKVTIEAKEVEGRIAEGASYMYWTFDGTVPGPMIRAREGDTVELTLKNSLESKLEHNIDLHAVTGPGGGAVLTKVKPGESKSFRFKALNPGVYIYHCATPPIDMHISSGMYGLIVIEPAAGLAPVDHEFYLCQGDIYTKAPTGTPGKQEIDGAKMAAEQPTYVVFNGAVGSATGDRAFKAKVGERIRIFFGVGGPNLSSSFHVIGEIFDRVATWGSLNDLAENVQTVTVAPGGATMVEFKLEVPGTYTIVDHSLSRLTKGAAGQIVVEGVDNKDVFTQI